MNSDDYLQLYSLAWGEGAPVILVHDWGGSIRHWESLFPAIVTSGHTVYAVDLLGHGESPRPTDGRLYYAQLLYTAFRRWLDSLNLTQAPILIGHGLGGALCLRYAIGHPYRVAKLVLLNPVCAPDQYREVPGLLYRHPHLRQMAARYRPQWVERKMLGLTPRSSPALAQQLLTPFRQASPHILRIPASVPDLVPELLDLPTRTLLLWTDNDPLLQSENFPAWLEDMQDATGYSLGALSHAPQLEAPESTNAAILRFILGFA
ncbi:MAG: hypothetical protein OHK0031_14450 [Anaerolineales bacterium]